MFAYTTKRNGYQGKFEGVVMPVTSEHDTRMASWVNCRTDVLVRRIVRERDGRHMPDYWIPEKYNMLQPGTKVSFSGNGKFARNPNYKGNKMPEEVPVVSSLRIKY